MQRSLTLVALGLSLVACGGSTAAPGADAGAVGCPQLNGNETAHEGDLTKDETWAGDGTVHHVTSELTLRGVTLTLAPCAVVKLDAQVQLTVDGSQATPAKLVSQGTAARPVLITATDATKPWGSVRGYYVYSTVDFAYTTLENGGALATNGASLALRGGDDNAVIPVVKVDHLTISRSAGIGLVLESGAAFVAGSAEVTIKDSGNDTDNAAVQIAPMAAGTLPHLNLSNNNQNLIRVVANLLVVPGDLHLKNVGAPYYFSFDKVRVHVTGGSPTLTIDPGVELRFDDYMEVGYMGSGTTTSDEPATLIAVGTEAQPIVFTSSKASPAAGDWPGLWLVLAPGSRLEHVHIDYAGGFNGVSSANCKPLDSDDHAALMIGWGNDRYVPAASSFVGVSISHSKSHAINAMWTTDSFGPDVTGSFTFDDVGRCKQTKNGRTSGCGGQEGCLQ